MNIASNKRAGSGIEPAEDLIEAIRAAVAEKGEQAVAAELKIARATVARLCGGLSVRRGTIELARLRLGLAS